MTSDIPFLRSTTITPVVPDYPYSEGMVYFFLDGDGRLLLYIDASGLAYFVAESLEEGLLVLAKYRDGGGGLIRALEGIDEETGRRTGDQLGLGRIPGKPFILSIKKKHLRSLEDCESYARNQIRERAIFVKNEDAALANISLMLKTVKRWEGLSSMQMLVSDEGVLEVLPYYRNEDSTKLRELLERYSKNSSYDTVPVNA
ncbi:hypothetical protein HK102_007952, partial [Quaeritorhiza haematococci]